MLHWTIGGREPGVHEVSLRRYGSKLVYHIIVYFFIYISYSYLQIQYIDTIITIEVNKIIHAIREVSTLLVSQLFAIVYYYGYGGLSPSSQVKWGAGK